MVDTAEVIEAFSKEAAMRLRVASVAILLILSTPVFVCGQDDPDLREGLNPRRTNNVTKTTIEQNNFAGLLVQLTFPNNAVVDYSYDAAGRPTSATGSGGITYALNATYAPHGALASVQNGASLVSTYFYNSRLQPCRISVRSSGSAPVNCADTGNIGNVVDFTYGFNLGTANNGNVAGIANNRVPDRSQTFVYDELNRIATAQTQATASTSLQHCWGETFSYDLWGNLLTIGGIQPTYNGCQQENLGVTVTVKNQMSGYCYDAAGNLVLNSPCPQPPGTAFTPTYSYDAENRMTATAGVTYTYDGDGKRVKKDQASGSTYDKLYWYGMGSDPLLETDLAGNNGMEFVFFGGKRIARRDSGGAVAYFFADHLGTSRAVTNAAGGNPDESDFYPFGGERVVSETLPNQNYKFTGKERDTESTLDFFIARHYASNLGRFVSVDPGNTSGFENLARGPSKLEWVCLCAKQPVELRRSGRFELAGL
jgi:RHS repeat-associated protein